MTQPSSLCFSSSRSKNKKKENHSRCKNQRRKCFTIKERTKIKCAEASTFTHGQRRSSLTQTKIKFSDQEKELTKITCAEARISTHGQRRLRQPQFHWKLILFCLFFFMTVKLRGRSSFWSGGDIALMRYAPNRYVLIRYASIRYDHYITGMYMWPWQLLNTASRQPWTHPVRQDTITITSLSVTI